MKTITLTIFTTFTVFLTDISNLLNFNQCDDTFEVIYDSPGVEISTNGAIDILKFDNKKTNFGVSEGKPTKSNFYLNTNFFTPSGDPIGLVVIDGKRKSNRVKGGAYFYVRNGEAHVKSRGCPYDTKFATQTILWGIDNKKINLSLTKKGHANQLRYRILVGENTKGEIVILVSRVRLTIKELLVVGVDQNIVDGALFDGGSSVEYSFNDGKFSRSFKAMSDLIKVIIGTKQQPTFMTANVK
tara:strand:+ start:2976 stop:3701 length:726 start_codon:yes stop_codon:yes gene_type:complete